VCGCRGMLGADAALLTHAAGLIVLGDQEKHGRPGRPGPAPTESRVTIPTSARQASSGGLARATAAVARGDVLVLPASPPAGVRPI
jgi:hypothetical protein